MKQIALVAPLLLASCHAGFGAGVASSPPPAERSRQIVLSDKLVCVRDGGRVRCGELTAPDGPLAGGPALDGVDVVDLALGSEFGCVATRGGEALCFGDNRLGELGARSRAEKSDTPLPVAGISGVRRVFAGPSHACAIADGGRVYCWGNNASGQIGSPVHYESAARELVAPFEVAGARGAVTLALSSALSCALDAAGAMACWGTKLESGAFPPDQQALAAPASLEGFSRGFDDLAAGRSGFCGLRGGDLFCWGGNLSMFGEDSLRPPRLHAQGLSGVRRAAPDDLRTCALHDDGRVSCWGRGIVGGGNKPLEVVTSKPRTVQGMPPAVDVDASGELACALTAAGEVYCWGAWPWAKTPTEQQTPRRVRAFGGPLG